MSVTASVKEATYGGVPVLTAAECCHVIQRHLTEDAVVLNVTTSTLGDAPAGFLGDHFRVTIIASSGEISPQQTTEINLFVKTVPTNPTYSRFAINSGAFQKEIRFFSVLINDLKKYSADVLSWSGKCYLTTPSKLVFEDLSVRGFMNLGPRCTMDYEHCVLTLQTLARFHASAIVYEEKETRCTGVVCRFNELHPEQYFEGLWVTDTKHPCRSLYETAVKATTALLKYLPDMKQDELRYQDVAKRMWSSYTDMCTRMTTRMPDPKIRNVQSHGDLWANNILFSYGSDVTKPVEARIVDYQLLRYSSPANDFLCFLHLTTRRRFRDEHLIALARCYHAALGVELARHQLDVEALIPWHQFQTGLDEYRDLAILTASLELPIIHLPGEMVAEILPSPERFQSFMFEERVKEYGLCFETDPEYKELVMECLDELLEQLLRRE